MSVSYDLFLEGRVVDEWRCLCPSFTDKEGNRKLAPIMSGRSVLGHMLQEIDRRYGPPKALSPEVSQMLWRSAGAQEGTSEHIDEHYVGWFFVADIKCDPTRFEHEAYVTREAMNSFEVGSTDEIWSWLTPEEYGLLPPDEKQAYTYYRWSEPWGTYSMKCRLKQIATELAEMYDAAILIGEEGYPDINDLRIVIRIS